MTVRWATALGLVLVSAGWVHADRPPALSPQTLTLPSGPTSLKGLGESFSAQIATGNGSYSIPIELPPGLLKPDLALSYSLGRGKTEIGMGFRLSSLRIYRTTDKGLPKFDETDRFAVEGSALNDELVLVNPTEGYYRLKNEGAFALFVRDVRGNSWTIRFPGGETGFLGTTPESRQDTTRGTFAWHMARREDRFGHAIEYRYVTDQGHRYLSSIRYQLHTAPLYQNHVLFTYEDRADSYTDYTYGEGDTTAKRLKTIEVFHGDRRIRLYHLTYQQRSLFSLLETITLEGEQGLRMPSLSFGYSEPKREGQPLVAMAWTPPLEGLLSGEAVLEDVNGDGLPDLLYGTAGNYRYYENFDGVRWREDPIKIANPPDRSLNEPDVLLADVNGDGFRDVVYAQDNAFRGYPGGDIHEGVFRAYGGPDTLRPITPLGVHWGAAEVKLSDVNRDGRTDLLVQGTGLVRQVMNGNDGLLRESMLPALPVDVTFTDPLVALLDFNGDGLLDFVRKEISWEQGRIRVWYGIGWGRYLSEQSMTGVPAGDGSEFYLEDVNHDGQCDLLRISGTALTYYVNNGRGTFNAGQGNVVVPPSWEARRILFADMNGNGTTDIVWLTTDHKLKYLDLFLEPYPGLLTRIDNGMGYVTTMSYRPSTEYMIEAKRAGRPWKTPMAATMPLLAEITTTDSFDKLGFEANETRTTYVYRDGFYDGREREFRGFANVVETSWGDEHHETKVTETWLHIGRNIETREDEEVLKGKPYQQVIRGIDGKIYQSIETTWKRRWLCQSDLVDVATVILPQCSPGVDPNKNKDRHVALALQTQALTGYWEKTDSPRYTYSKNSHKPGWGHLSEEARFGEVAFPGPRAIGDAFSEATVDTTVGHDEVVTKATYIDDVERWLIGLPIGVELFDIQGKRVSASRTYYDGPDFVGLELGKVERGKATRQESWLHYEDVERWIAVSRQALNSHGQMIATLDANDNRRELRYDNETSTFVTEERIEVRNGWLAYRAWYDRARGQLEGATDFNGHTTRFLYDGLGRLEKLIDPLSSVEQPLTHYTYTYATDDQPISVTKVEQLKDAQTAEALESWTYTDGLGRQRLVKTKAEVPLGFVGTGWSRFSSRGQRVVESAAFAGSTSGLEKPASTTPCSIISFDALDRTVKTRPPILDHTETYQLTQYLPLETRLYDERDTLEGTLKYPHITRVDGLGRIVEQRKYNDYDDVRTELSWKAAYNALGSITSISDPATHLRTYKYDTLNRMRQLHDPNAGTLNFVFDDVGNLAERVDALGQKIVWDYEKGNRIKARRLMKSGDLEEDINYVFHYDAPGPGLPEAKNLLGRIAWIEQPVGNVYWSYDLIGQTAITVQELRHPEHGSGSNLSSYRLETEYDRLGNVTEERFPANLTVKRRYSPRGLLQEISARIGSQNLYGASLHYGSNAQPLRADYANNVTTCRWYDSRDRLHGLRTSQRSQEGCGDLESTVDGTIQHLKYTPGPEGVIVSIRDLIPQNSVLPRLDASFRYDQLHELVEAVSPSETVSYKYDAIQNLTGRAVVPPSNEFLSGDLQYGQNGAGPNAVTTAFGESYQYNAVGQLKGLNGFLLEFDAEGRLVVARKGDALQIRWLYDYEGKRLQKIVGQPGQPDNVYLYPFNGYLERDGAPTWYPMAEGTTLGEIAVATAPPTEHDIRYYHPDHLGSPTHVSNRLGELLSFSRWHAYGWTATETGPRPTRTFTGAERHEDHGFGLIEMGARWYAPNFGRWISPDPLFLSQPKVGISEPLQLNSYSYALNNPMNFRDPTGMCAINADLSLDCAAPAFDASSTVWGETKAAALEGRYGTAAVGGLLFLANQVNVIAGVAAQLTIGSPWNSGVEVGSGFLEGNWDKALRGSTGLLALGVGGKFAQAASGTLARVPAPGGVAAPGLNALSQAGRYGVRPYSQLRGPLKGTGLEGHHLIEKRFAGLFNQRPSGMMSIAVTRGEHQAFTNQWRQLIPYGEGTVTATQQQVIDAARNIYSKYPELLKALGL